MDSNNKNTGGNQLKWMLLPFFILLPFMQMGLSYYMSVQTLLLAFLIYHIPIKTFIRQSYWYCLLFFVMVMPSFLYNVAEQFHMILWAFRLFVCVMILLAVLSLKSKSHIDSVFIEKPILVFLSILCLFTFIQFVGLKVGHPVMLSSSLFVTNGGTMEGFEKAISLGLSKLLRPSAFYGEPSYLSFIVTSLVFISLSVFKRKTIYKVMVLGLLTCMLAQSFSGILAIAILYLVFYTKGNIQAFALTVGVGTIVVSLLLLFSEHLWFMQRFLSIGSQESSVIRLVLPFGLIAYAFDNYPFGMPQDVLQSEFAYGALGTDNGFLNMFINFGYSGFIIWGVIVFKLRKNILALSYVLLSSMFNGAFLAFDKVAVIAFCFIVIANAKYINTKLCRGMFSQVDTYSRKV